MYLPAIATIQSQHGLITFGQLCASGLDAHDVRRLVDAGSLVRMRRGVYADGEAWAALEPYRAQPMLRIRAAQHSLRSTHVLSHDSAAIAHHMGAPAPKHALVHVTRAKVHGDAVRAGVKHHRAPYRQQDLAEVEGLRMLGPARTALDMVREHGRAHGLAACDAAMRRGVTRADLRLAFEVMQSWPHSRCMRWCIEHADSLAESYLESLGRDFVLELGIGQPVLQFGLSDGTTTAFTDILVARHFFEVDGMLKYAPANPSGPSPDDVLRREKVRTDFLTGFKLGSSRLTHHDLFAGRSAALRRVAREFEDTCRRFGTEIDDLTPYRVSRNLRGLSV